MDLKLEGILETLLVGAMAALVILSFIFFTFGHIWHVPVMQRFFDTLFAKRHQGSPRGGENPVGEPSARPRIVKRRRPEPHFNFLHILLLALLYGLGVVAEGASHNFRKIDDSGVKRASFEDVAHGQLKSGTAQSWIAQFISDADACKALAPSLHAAHTSSLLCGQINDRILEFFHNAKNSVLQNHEFNDELSALETRINFMRSFYAMTWILMIELLVVVIVATIAEVGRRRFERAWTRWWRRRALGGAAIELGRHWADIAAFHCLLLLAGAVGLYFACHYACNYWEDQFAKRIFGYYLSLPQFRADPPGEAGKGTSHDPLALDISPHSPYHVFSLATLSNGVRQPAAQRRLEPSAVRILGHSSRIIVANEQGGQQPFWLFTLNDDATELFNPVPIPVNLNRGIEDIQGLAVFEVPEHSSTCPDQQKPIQVFALPTDFVGKKEKASSHLVSFCLDASGPAPQVCSGPAPQFCVGAAPRVSSGAAPQFNEGDEEDLPSPCPNAAQSCSVEGITVLPDGRTFLFGIQSINGKPAVAITRSTRTAPGKWTTFEQVFPGRHPPVDLKTTMEAGSVGISDLAAAPSGRIYVTVSRQKDAKDTAKRTTKEEGASDRNEEKGALSEVGGSLWIVDLGCGPNAGKKTEDCGQQKATLLETFIHKPKGVATDDGSVLVVFDDEARRKSLQWAPVTFPLGQDESVFVMIPSPEYP